MRRIPLRHAAVLVAFVIASIGVGQAVLRAPEPTAAPAPSRSPTPSASPTPVRASPSPSPTVKPASTKPRAPRPAGSPTYSSGPVNIPLIACGSQTATRTVRFRVKTQDGLGVSPHDFASAVRTILCDERSWRAAGTVRFRYDPKGSLLIGLRSPDESERRCMELIKLSVRRRYSCAGTSEVVINSDRWLTGAPRTNGVSNYPRPLAEYRQMLINHEVGHILRLRHQKCTGNGDPAPVMMQQSKGMRSDNGKVCTPNPWPLPAELQRLRALA